LNQTAAKSGKSLNEAKTSFEDSIQQKAENLRSSLTDNIEASITSLINNWFKEHPIVFWIVNHPIADLVILLVLIFLFWGLLRAIASLTEKAWISVLIAPFKLIQSFLGLGSKSLGNVMGSELVTVASNQTLTQSDRFEDVANIINQLNALKQQQDKLLQELATILESYDLKVN
jgi:methyl-accepting chemotaxis protein